jgi:cytochrome c oxidase assembly protein subunit 15
VSAWRHHRRTPQIFWPTLAAFLLVGFEGWLGGVVVQEELTAWIVTAHLIVALVIVSLLLYSTLFALFRPGNAPAARVHGRRGWLVASMSALLVVTLVQIALGAQVREAIDEAMTAGVVRDAALAAVGAFDRWHRDVSLVVLGVMLAVLLQMWARREREAAIVRSVNVTVALVVVQLVLGLTLAYFSLTPVAQIAHLTVASLLLGSQTVTLLLARWLP